jgi:hypothetical protein
MVVRIFTKSRGLVVSRISKSDCFSVLSFFFSLTSLYLGFLHVYEYVDRVVELKDKEREARSVVQTAPESKVLSKENSFWSQGYKVVVKTPNMPAESIFVTVDDYARLKPSDTVCIQYSQLDGKNQDFQLCPKK